MKIALVNFSGNVGKTTLAQHLFAPKLGAVITAIESINSGGEAAGAVLESDDYNALSEELMLADPGQNVVVDVGSSNIESVMNSLKRLGSADIDFDAYVLPVIADAKQQIDTIATIDALSELGVSAEKIIVIPNIVEKPKSLEKDFERIYRAGEIGVARVSSVPVLAVEVYGKLKEIGDKRSVFEVANDETVSPEAARALTDAIDRQAMAAAVIRKRLATFAAQNLDEVWKIVGPMLNAA